MAQPCRIQCRMSGPFMFFVFAAIMELFMYIREMVLCCILQGCRGEVVCLDYECRDTGLGM